MSTRQFAIEVQNASGSNRVPSEQQLRAWSLAAFNAPVDGGAPAGAAPAAPTGGELTIRIVGERESADLNSRYRGKRGPTNVLAFMAEPPPAPGEEMAREDASADRVADAPRADDGASNSEGNSAGNTRRSEGTLRLRERDGNTRSAGGGDAQRAASAGNEAASAGNEAATGGNEAASADNVSAQDGNASNPASGGAAPSSELLPLGDLVICAPVLAREAREQRKPFDAHWAHIVIHGVLHLLGYDHETDEQAGIMEDRERKILAGLGFQDPYAVRS